MRNHIGSSFHSHLKSLLDGLASNFDNKPFLKGILLFLIRTQERELLWIGPQEFRGFVTRSSESLIKSLNAKITGNCGILKIDDKKLSSKYFSILLRKGN